MLQMLAVLIIEERLIAESFINMVLSSLGDRMEVKGGTNGQHCIKS